MSEKISKKIMLVDDDRFLQDMYSKKFSEGGFDVTSCANADDALEQLKGGYLPDIIVTDVIMPGKTGLDFLKEMRQENLAKESIFILLTNEDSNENIQQGKELGMHGYLVKALLTPSEVVNSVQEIYSSNK